jgi:NAD dependent epimerase/dehydratase family enzyme
MTLQPRSPLDGVVHATGPHPARNAELMAALRKVVRRPAAPPTPAPLVRLGAVLLRTDPALALTGRRAVPSLLLAHGFEFAHPNLDEALADLVRQESRAT